MEYVKTGFLPEVAHKQKMRPARRTLPERALDWLLNRPHRDVRIPTVDLADRAEWVASLKRNQRQLINKK